MLGFVFLCAAVICFICATLGAGPWELGSATIAPLPLGLVFFAAAFLANPTTWPWRQRA